jgi:hypothetical protein
MLINTNVGPNDYSEIALAAVLIWDGSESCRVGFLPKSYVAVKHQFVGRFAQITALPIPISVTSLIVILEWQHAASWTLFLWVN